MQYQVASQSPRSKAKLEYVHVANENVRTGQVRSHRVRSSQVKSSQVKSVYAGQLRGNCMSKRVSSKKEYLAAMSSVIAYCLWLPPGSFKTRSIGREASLIPGADVVQRIPGADVLVMLRAFLAPL